MPDAAVSSTTPLVPFQNLPYPPESDTDRETLLRFVRETPLVYGSWNVFKSLYKRVEADPNADPILLAAMIARIEDARAGTGRQYTDVDLGGMQHVLGCSAAGEHLFMTGGRYYWDAKELFIFRRNTSNPNQPIFVTALRLFEDYATRIESSVLCGNLLCCLTGTSQRSDNKTLLIVDVSDPTYPRLHGKLTISGKVTVATNPQSYPYLYLAVARKSALFSPKSELQVVDLSNPDKPMVVGKTEITGLDNVLSGAIKGNVSVSGTTATLSIPPRSDSEQDASHKGGLRFVDISNPKSPRLVGSMVLETAAFVARRGSFAYVSVRSKIPANNGLQIVAVSDPRVARSIGFCPLPGNLGEITFSTDGKNVYINTDDNLLTVNIGDPSRPVHVGTVKDLRGTDVVMAGDIAYVPTASQGIQLLSLTRPQTPRVVSEAPSGETMGYMKRRGRRFLRQLAKTNPARYAETATELLLAMTGKDATIDQSRHWATIDVLFGGGTRYRQTKHGRGRYLETGQPRSRLALRAREERSPDAWDTRPYLLARLLQTPDLLPPIQTFAARALRATDHELPALPDVVLEQWLASTEPLLVALAVKRVANRLLSGESLAPTITADAFFKSGAAVRQTLAQTRADGWSSNKRWAGSFAVRLAEQLAPKNQSQIRFSKRQTTAAALIARHFTWAIIGKPDVLLPLIAPLLASGRADFQSLVVAGAGQAAPSQLLAWLSELVRVPEPELREATIVALSNTIRPFALNRILLRALVFHGEQLAREMGWRLIAASTIPDVLLQEVWKELLQSREPTPALSTAMASAYALGLLERAGIGAAELATHLAERPFLVGLLSAEAFDNVAATAPASVVLGLVAASPDSHWATLRPVWLGQLREGIGTAALWLAAENALNTDDTGLLEARLLGDAEIAETFLMVDDERLLEIREPGFGPLLARWIERYIERFTRNSALLFDAATHPLPEVRTPALARVAELGMDMPFALRLVESAVPPSMAVGQSFFNDEPAGGDREFDYALALCDSPDNEVRRMGIEYVRGRFGTLDQERVLSALFENPAPETQAFVAEQLVATTNRPFATPVFDAEVLRTTNRARVAKERIKVRQTAEPTIDVATLLTIARGRTPRDAEWALAELARRAVRGEAIEGVTVEGVIGV